MLNNLGLGKFGIAEGADSNINHLSTEGVKTYMANFPAGASYQTLNHFRQILIAEKF